MSEKTNEGVKRVIGIDILRVICSFLVVCIHVSTKTGVGKNVEAIARVAVPIFLMITGFFYNGVEKSNRVNKQIKKVFKYVVLTNILYFVWQIIVNAASNGNISLYFRSFELKTLMEFIFLNNSPFAWHIWYLNALLYVLIIVKFLDKFFGKQYTNVQGVVFLVFNLILGQYSAVIFGKSFSKLYTRNFLFLGIPYFCVGRLLRCFCDKNIRERKETRGVIYIVAIVCFSFTTILERMNFVWHKLPFNGEHYISSFFLSVSIFLLFYEYYFNKKTNGFDMLIARIGRKYSLGIFIIHMIVLDSVQLITNNFATITLSYAKICFIVWGISLILIMLLYYCKVFIKMLLNKFEKRGEF